MGTVAWLLVAGQSEGGLFRALPILSGLEFLGLLALFGLLLAGLVVTAWRTAAASWLTDGPRGKLLWALVVAAAGFAGWGFAATVTFVAEFSHGTQIALAYLAGGLPFVLVAAMLQRPWRVNLAAGVGTAVAVLAGVWVAGIGLYGVLAMYFTFLQMMFLPIYAAA